MKLKSACLLLGLCHAGATAAIGLGEISVRSSLGQPLHATVPLLDMPAATTADCFSLGPSGDSIVPPPHAQLSIERAGGQALLHIRSRQAINDPIAQFVLVSDCEARLQRDYVVLLDPPMAVVAPLDHDAPAVTHTATEAPPVAASAAVPAPPPARPQRRVQRVSAAAAPPAATPRLVLSGKREPPRTADSAATQPAGTGLQDQAHVHARELDATELSDENTALTRKLAHLEAQLAALQRRHAELEARAHARAATTTTAPPPPEQPAQWPLYLLAIGLLSGGALAAWRRRPAALTAKAARIQLETVPLKTLSEMTQAPAAKPEPAPQRMPEIAPPPLAEEGTEVKEDILDQAEVFMAHGHGELAVHLLQEHLRAAPGESPVPWLLLLDLLHREGDTAGYTSASDECRRYFNINLTGHPVSQDNEQSQGLEAYPHLLEQMVKIWGTPDIGAFFHDLIYDNRGGTRMGFEPGAYRDILFLRELSRQQLALAA
ncbi:FimV family protein [Thiobacillus denitrificans]|uniref:type IV pilus assembly protein FimV n=1 Tax=Thiobacillus denitrificans TaxID=36861 RepID=UPI000366C520|nr:hypothetical protein [Thiobacillus denitrificans]